ncbi:MAG: recombinase family protein [Desertimonas sp.]
MPPPRPRKPFSIGRSVQRLASDQRVQVRRLGRPPVVSATTADTIGQWRAAGCSFQAIAAALNANGTPTAHGRREWYPSTVRSIHRRWAA